MSGLINDSLRTFIAYGIRVTGLLTTLAQRIRIAGFHRRQQQLRVRYAIDDQTPVLSYGREIVALINQAVAGVDGQVQFALTSGSTGTPKRILFTKSRLRSLKLTFTDFFVRCCWAFSLRRTSLYVFSSLIHDQSLTSMLLSETRLPLYFSTLQAPYRVQSHPALRRLASTYGATAVRLWVLVIANPGVIYSTNPSTISTFLDDLATRWQSSSKLVRDWHYQPQIFDKSLHRIARRLCARGAAGRIARIARSEKPLSLEGCAPAVATYICWTGGYVQPFLKRLATYLPPNRYRLIPMYSMSTETVETVGCINGKSVTFVPLALDVHYEFIPESEDDLPSKILQPAQLQVGQTYSLIVSDNYGLRRYQTADLFLCEGKLSGLPQLTFVRRKNLEYSFTGEKLTEQQVHSAFQSLRDDIPELALDFMTVVPSQPADESVPHYKLVIVSESQHRSEASSEQIAQRCDEILAEINCEYKSKRESGRLGPVRLVCADPNSFARKLHGKDASSWETQFKFLPLYRQTWESGTMSPAHSIQCQTVSTVTR
ncbi:MAG TPA: GH3 auxin-responsive promoter family protein [Pyrinomonadaceae bacterium]